MHKPHPGGFACLNPGAGFVCCFHSNEWIYIPITPPAGLVVSTGSEQSQFLMSVWIWEKIWWPGRFWNRAAKHWNEGICLNKQTSVLEVACVHFLRQDLSVTEEMVRYQVALWKLLLATNKILSHRFMWTQVKWCNSPQQISACVTQCRANSAQSVPRKVASALLAVVVSYAFYPMHTETTRRILASCFDLLQ